jgi:hypothetical protein
LATLAEADERTNRKDTMSAYGTLSPTAIYPGDVITVFKAETPTAGATSASASQAVALAGPYNAGNTGLDVSGFFSGDPGTFELDVQVSNDDVDAHYQTVANGNITSVDSTNNTFHFDGATVKAAFARLLMRTRGNVVSVTATIGR